MNLDAAVADRWPPEWVNGPEPSMISYSPADAVVRREGNVLRIVVDNQLGRLLHWFMPSFMIFAASICWFAVEDREERIITVVCVVIFGGLTYIGIDGLQTFHLHLGDYLAVDQTKNHIRLPRLKREVDLHHVVAFQVIHGPSKSDQSCDNVDLYFLAVVDDKLYRYHVAGNPSADVLDAVSGFTGLPVVKTVCPSGWYRNSDVRDRTSDV